MICRFYRWLDDGAGLAERPEYVRTVRPGWAAVRQSVRVAVMAENERTADTANYEVGGGPEAGVYASASGLRYVSMIGVGGVWQWTEEEGRAACVS